MTSKLDNIWESLKIEPLTSQQISALPGVVDTISLGSEDVAWANDTISLGSITGITNGTTINTMGATTAGHIYTTTGINQQWQTPYTIGPNGTAHNSGQLHLNGNNADIMINGRSLMEVIGALEDRLNMLRPNPELEKEWDQLRELGEQYRKLEAELKEKTKMWTTLKHMPPPEIE